MRKDVAYVKNDILDFFRSMNADKGHALPAGPFQVQRMNHYNPKQRAAFDQAVDELVSEGLVERREDDIFLTQKGVDEIY